MMHTLGTMFLVAGVLVAALFVMGALCTVAWLWEMGKEAVKGGGG